MHIHIHTYTYSDLYIYICTYGIYILKLSKSLNKNKVCKIKCSVFVYHVKDKNKIQFWHRNSISSCLIYIIKPEKSKI